MTGEKTGKDELRGTHLRVSGRVQGVGFRFFVVRRAVELGLVGYTRNLADGDVEIWAEGSRESLDSLVEAVMRGPQLSRVDGVEARESGATGTFREFEIRY